MNIYHLKLMDNRKYIFSIKRHILIIVFANLMVLTTSIIGYSQSIWYKTFGSWNAGEHGRRIIQTYDGGYLALIFQGNLGPDYYYLLKLDGSGNLLWRKLLADSTDKSVYEFQQTSDSGFIFTGWCDNNPWGGLLIKTDKNGNFKWQKNYTNLSYQTRFNTVKQTLDRGFICCGSYYDLINGGQKGVVVKTDSLGNVQWDKQYTDSLMNNYVDIIQDSLGNYYLTGLINNPSVNPYTIVKKINPVGNYIWTKIFGSNTRGISIVQLQNKFIMIIGTAMPIQIPIATKLDTAGNIKWSNNYPYSTMNLYSCKDNFDNIIFAGNVDTNNIATIRIKKIDSSGVLLKNKLIQFTGYNFIASQCIKPTNDLGFIVAGNAVLLDSFNNTHPFSLILKTDSAFNTPLITKTKNHSVTTLNNFEIFQNYPNPFNSKTAIKIIIPNNGYIYINIYNVLGKTILSNKKYFYSGLNEYSINFNDYTLSSGVYFVKINFDSGNTVSKLIKVIYSK